MDTDSKNENSLNQWEVKSIVKPCTSRINYNNANSEEESSSDNEEEYYGAL